MPTKARKPKVDHLNVEVWRSRGGTPPEARELEFHPLREWRLDYAWPTHMIALECEGGVWNGGRHTRPQGFLNDIEKYNTATAMGWRVLRCTPATINQLVTIEWVQACITGIVPTEFGA